MRVPIRAKHGDQEVTCLARSNHGHSTMRKLIKAATLSVLC